MAAHDTNPMRPGGSFWLAAAAITLAALVLRIGWLAFVPDGLAANTLPPVDDRGERYQELLVDRLSDDQAFYARSAQYLSDGEGYREPFSEAPTARWAPGYSMVLAAMFRVGGPDLLVARLLNAACGALAVLLTIDIGRRIASERAGLIAGALLAFFPAPVFMTSLIMTEAVFTAGLLAVVWMMLRIDGPRLIMAIPVGLATGLLALVRPEVIVLLAAFAAAWLAAGGSWPRALGWTAVAACAVVAVAAPWTLRNAVTLDAFVPLTTGTGGALIQGHAPGADGALNQMIYNDLRAGFAGLPEPERQIAENRKGVRESLEFAATHPRDELTLIPRKVFHLFARDPGGRTWAQLDRWGVRGQSTLEPLGNAYFIVVLLMAGAGLAYLSDTQSRRWVLLGGVLVGWVAVYGFVYVGDGRYHLPLTPLLCLLAALALANLWPAPAGRKEAGEAVDAAVDRPQRAGRY